MKIDNLKGLICTYFNGNSAFDIPFVKSPTNNKAPKGNYIAVGVEQVEQVCQGFQPPAGKGVITYPYVASVYFVEVEGDGDNLRAVLNEIQGESFISYAREKGFTLWENTNLMRIDTYDGEFYVRQWRFACRINFTDSVDVDKPTINSVDASYVIK